MELTLTAAEWILIANIYDNAPAPADARSRRRQDRLYDLLWDWREELKTGDLYTDVMHDLPQSYVLLMQKYLSDRSERNYRQASWKQFIQPILTKLGWVDPESNTDDEEELP